MLFSAFLRTVLKRIKKYEVIIIVLGVLFGILTRNVDSAADFSVIVRDQPHNMLYIFVPAIIFEVTYFMDFHQAFKSALQIFLLGIPACGMSSLLSLCFEVYLSRFLILFDCAMIQAALGVKECCEDKWRQNTKMYD